MILRCISSSLPRRESPARQSQSQRESCTGAIPSWLETLSMRMCILGVAMTRFLSFSRGRMMIAGPLEAHWTQALGNSSKAKSRRMLSATRLPSLMALSWTSQWEWSHVTPFTRITSITHSHMWRQRMEQCRFSPLQTPMGASSTGISPSCDIHPQQQYHLQYNSTCFTYH